MMAVIISACGIIPAANGGAEVYSRAVDFDGDGIQIRISADH